MNVQIKEIEPMNVAFIHHIGPYAEIAAAYEKLMSWAGKNGLIGPQTKVIGLYYDDPEDTPADKCRSDACITVDGDVKTEGEIGTKTIFGGDYAVATHVGSYDKLIDAWNYLYGQWPSKSGREASFAPAIEIYLNSPEDTPPEELITELYMPLQK